MYFNRNPQISPIPFSTFDIYSYGLRFYVGMYLNSCNIQDISKIPKLDLNSFMYSILHRLITIFKIKKLLPL